MGGDCSINTVLKKKTLKGLAGLGPLGPFVNPQRCQVPTSYLVVATAGPVAMSLDICLGLYKA